MVMVVGWKKGRGKRERENEESRVFCCAINGYNLAKAQFKCLIIFLSLMFIP